MLNMENFDLYIVTGNSGTGKSTVADKIGKSLGVEICDPDLMRRKLGIETYDTADTHKVMTEIYRSIENSLRHKKPAVLCTAYVRRTAREQSYKLLRKISDEVGLKLKAILIRCSCEEDIAKSRIEARSNEAGLHSPGNDPSIYDKYRKLDESISSDEINQNPDVSFLAYDSDKNITGSICVRPHHQQQIEMVTKIIQEM